MTTVFAEKAFGRQTDLELDLQQLPGVAGKQTTPEMSAFCEFAFALSTPFRMRILFVMFGGAQTVNDIAVETGLAYQCVIGHINALIRSGLAKGTKTGAAWKYLLVNREAVRLAFFTLACFLNLREAASKPA